MRKKNLLGFTILSVLLISLALVGLNKSFAHCDTLNGPVIKDARLALEKGDVTSVLKWVKKGAEPEIRAAFNTTIEERAKNSGAKEKADMKFFETLVRIHRAGEGASFTGLKPAESIEPIVTQADKALETGSVDNLADAISKHLTTQIKEKFNNALEKKKQKDTSLEAGREYVEAYIEYVHYVEGTHNAIAGKAAHHDE